MSMLALDINDAGIVAFDGRDVRYREPGYALLDDGELTTGNSAWRQARLRPRHIQDHFWSRLDTEALPDQRFRHLSAADLVSRQLEQIAAAAGSGIEQVIVAVPAYMEAGNLGLFLGICNELGLPVTALVDAAVAATRREYSAAVPVHVDISLHSALLTRLGQPGKAQVEKADVVDAAGVAVLNDAWVRVIAEAFVRQSRFDPLHTAETEQLLFDRLPDWLDAAAGGTSLSLEITHGGLTHAAEIDGLALTAAAAPVYQRIVTQLRALVRAGETPALQLTDRAARLPGLADMLRARVGGEVFLLESAATARGLYSRGRGLGTGGAVALLRQLPWDQASVTVEVTPDDGDGGRPTHVLFGNHAYAINEEPLALGTRAEEDGRWIVLEAAMPGVSRRHCTLEIDNNQCVVRDVSRFGTFLNGHRLEGSAVLQAGDTIRVGTPGYELRLITVERDHGA